MPAQIQPISEEQYDAILDRQGHEPCPGVMIEFNREVRPAGPHGPRLYATIFRPEGAPASSASTRPALPSPASPQVACWPATSPCAARG